MLKTISLYVLLPLVVVVAGILIYASTKPDTMHYQRSASIKAPPEKIFPLINDFHRWGTWSPYENEGPRHEADLQRPAGTARAPSTSGTATRTSARAAWRSRRSRRRPR